MSKYKPYRLYLCNNNADKDKRYYLSSYGSEEAALNAFKDMRKHWKYLDKKYPKSSESSSQISSTRCIISFGSHDSIIELPELL